MDLEALLAAVLLVAVLGYVLLGARIAELRESAGSRPAAVLFFVIGIWVAGGAVELLAGNFTVFSIGRTGHFVGTALVPLVALVFFREYMHSRTRSSMLALLSVIPLVSITLAATNAHHEFMWYLPRANEAGEFLTRPALWGPWFLYVHLPYSYLLIGGAIVALLRQSSRIASAQRRGLYMLGAASVVPLAATLAYDLGFGPDTVSYVPFVLAACLPAYAWLVFRADLFDLAPLSYEAVFQNILDPVIVIDDRYRVIGMNRGAERMIGMSEAGARRQPLDSLLDDHATPAFMAMQSGSPQRMTTAKGKVMLVQASVMRSGRAPASAVYVLMFRDITDTQESAQDGAAKDKLMNTIIDQSGNGMVRLRWFTGEHGERQLRAIFANTAAGRYLDIDTKELRDKTAVDIVRRATTGMNPRAAAGVVQEFETATGSGSSLDIDVECRAPGGTRWLRMICEPVGNDFALTFFETTDRKAREREMEAIATMDALTGALNRRGFEAEAARFFAENGADARGALLFFDLNGFKQINDNLGHEVGDAVLRKAARRLRNGLREGDIVGRHGGDEFVALVRGADAVIAENLAIRLAEALEKHYVIGGRTVSCPASIGLAMYPDNANTLSGLLHQADQAMYRAKERVRSLRDSDVLDLFEKAG